MSATQNPPLRVPRELLVTLYGDGIPDGDDMKFPCPACHDRPLVERGTEPLLHDPDGRVSCSTGCDEDAIMAALWPAPRDLVPDALPPFPVDALPDRVALYVEAVAESTQTPADLAAGIVLAVASTAVLGAVNVELRPGWVEEPALYVAVVLPSGERKSAVLKAVSGPLRDVERERIAEAVPAVDLARARADALDAQRRKLVSSEDVDAEAVAELDAERRQLGAVRLPRMLADDATPEAVAGLLDAHGSLGVLSAEGAILANALGRYADGKSNVELLCKAYSAEPTVVDRRRGDPLMLDAPRLALGLCVQPTVLGALRDDDAARGQGLVARFVLLRPSSRVGTRDPNPPPMPAALAGGWCEQVRALAALPRAHPRTVTLSPEARAELDVFAAEHEPRLLAGRGDLARVADWACRHPGRVGRVALLLHALGDNDPDAIGGATMRAAVRIGEHLTRHALAVLDGDADRLAMAGVLSWLSDRAGGTVTVRDLHRGPCGGGRGPAERAHDVARRLAALGYLRELQRPSGTAGRPSSPAYAVHPLVGEVKPR